MFSYEWLGGCKKLSHVGPASYEDFYRSLESIITRNECEQFLKLLKGNYCATMGDWLQVYNVADVVSFIKALRKMAEQDYLDDVVIIPGI